MTALLLRAADSRWLRVAALALLWIVVAAAERLAMAPSGLRFPGLLLLAVLVTAWVAGRRGTLAAVAIAIAYAALSLRDAESLPGDGGLLLVFAVVASLGAALTLALREAVRERNALRARLDARAPRVERSAARERLAGDALRAAREAAHEARAARDELAAAHEKFAAFMAAFPYPAYLQDERGAYVFVNEAGRASTAWRDEVVGEEPAPERRWFRIRFPVEVAGRTWLGGIAIDVSARDRAERTLRSYEAELERAVRRRDEFLAVLAHELRNPLAPIQHSVQILHRAPQDVERVRRATATIDRQVALMERLIDDLLDVARISQGHVALEPRPRAMAALVDGALDVVRPVAERSGHRFAVRHEAPGAQVHVDALRAEQVVVNLLSNAVKYSPRGSTVRVTSGVDGAMGRIEVADEGQGILPEHLDEIFTMFARPGIGTSAAPQGTGVGLALARRLAEQHGGRIEARSAGRDRGATFTVWFPLAEA